MNKNVALIVLAAFFFAFGVGWLLMLVHNTVKPSTADDVVIGGCLAVAAIFAAPADLKDAVNWLAPALPWGRRSTDKPEDNPEKKP